METILHIVLKFQFDRVYFQGGDTSAKCGNVKEQQIRKKERTAK